MHTSILELGRRRNKAGIATRIFKARKRDSANKIGEETAMTSSSEHDMGIVGRCELLD
jgi:hypothetical protein